MDGAARNSRTGRKQEHSVAHLLHRASQLAERLFHNAGIDLTPRQLVLLSAISESGLADQTQLVALTGIDRSTVGVMLMRLSHRKLVERGKRLGDRRVREVCITDEGRRLLALATPIAREVEAKILATVSAHGRAALVEGLKVLAATTPSRAR